MFGLKGKKAIVTGAASGLGLQFAKALTRQGADVALLDIQFEKLQAAKKAIETVDQKSMCIKTDLTVQSEVQAAVEKVTKDWGRIDILVNNAGVISMCPAEHLQMQEWHRVMKINLDASFYMAQQVGQQMIKQKYGKIVNTASVCGIVASTTFLSANYHVSKFGVVGLTKALAAEWAKHNITVNAIAPFFFRTGMTEQFVDTVEFGMFMKNCVPMGRGGQEGELDGALIYFASDASTFTTGQIIAVDGGFTII